MIKSVLILTITSAVLADVSEILRQSDKGLSTPRPFGSQSNRRQAYPDIPSQGQVFQPNQEVIAILRQEQEQSADGSYRWLYETQNGISAQEEGRIEVIGPEEATKSVTGSFSYTSPEGIPISVTYVADENGFRPQGDHLPTPPPIPEAILRSLELNAANAPRQNF